MPAMEERITLSISGNIFETRKKTLRRFPETLLGNECRMLTFFCSKSHKYYFNRNRQAFEAILYFYQSDGDLRLPPNLRMEIFIQECQFYDIPRSYIDSMRMKAGVLPQTIARGLKEAKPILPPHNLRGKIWYFLEHPCTSKAAKYLAIFSFINIFFSVVLACIETIHTIQEKSKLIHPNPLRIAEIYLNSWFLLEVAARFLFCPHKIMFLRKMLNMVDIVAVVPYFIILSFKIDESTSLIALLRMLRFVRVFRLFRLSKHSARIKAVGDILRDSLQDLYIFVLCLFIMTIFSGAILYFTEMSHPETQFRSIPDSMWWALQTVVTLGYGDITPVTVPGKLYSSFFMVFGALTIALPVLSIVMKFTSMYSMEPEEETVHKKSESMRSKNSGSIKDGSMKRK